MINVADSARSIGSTCASNIAAGERHSHTEVYRRLRCYRRSVLRANPAAHIGHLMLRATLRLRAKSEAKSLMIDSKQL
jgi:hypothetical protein